jgi:hypothetical protein
LELEEASVELKNHVWEITIDVAAGEPEPAWTDPLLIAGPSADGPGLLDVLEDLKHNCHDAERIEVSKEAGTPITYGYVLTASGRDWNQRIRPAEPLADSAITFDVPDFWQLHEIQGARGPILRKLIELLNAYAIETMEVVWL